ncbi:MAG: hypothetical protein JJE03_05955 [Peptostreptococcaceae bacterium]|nr:hypothetical protein [Peptostreptococcaceae bacterium]
MKSKLFKLLSIILIFFIIFSIWSLSLYERVDSNVFRYNDWKKLESIDNLFLGASPVYRGYNANLANELTDQTCFSLGTSLQSFEGSYYLLKASNDSATLKNVYLQLSFSGLIDTPTSTRGDQIVIDYITDPIDKLMYSKSSLDQLVYIKPLSIYANSVNTSRPNFNQIGILKDNIHYLLNKNELEDDYSVIASSTQDYLGNGFVTNTTSVDYGNVEVKHRHWAFGDYSKKEDYKEIKYLLKIISYCKENDINLTLISMPYYPARFITIDNYSEYENYVSKLTEEYDVEYYNFNLIKIDYLDLTESEFKDDKHLNYVGAAKFTTAFSKLMALRTDGEDISKYFFSSWEEKQYEYNRVLGLFIESEVINDKAYIKSEAAIPTDLLAEYRYFIYVDNTLVTYVDYSVNDNYSFTLEENIDYLVRIESRQIGSTADYEAYQEIKLGGGE